MKRSTSSFFQLFFQQNYDSLVRFLASRYTDKEEAQDLAQDAFYNVMKVKDVEELEHARAYLFQTAANLALNRIRKQKRQEAYQQNLADSATGEAGDPIDSPERAAVARQQLQQVEGALASLPRKCRLAFLMHRSRNMSYQQIAAELGVSVSTVEKYMIAALEQCRAKVDWGKK